MYYELLITGKTVSGDRYRQQLIKLNHALKAKGKGRETSRAIFTRIISFWLLLILTDAARNFSKWDEPAQSTSKADIHQKQVMLSVWWDVKGIVYFELLPRNQSINSNVYCCQLMKLGKEMKKKRPELAIRKDVIFHQDNDRPHTSFVTRKKWLVLGWEVMPHPPYSPDLAPSVYHLFRSLQNHLNGKTFDSNEAVKNEFIQFFASKNQSFYESGIMKLTERWQKVIEQNI